MFNHNRWWINHDFKKDYEMNKEVTINMAIGPNRPFISKVGSTLGCQFSKPEAVSCLPDYEKKIQAAKDNNNIEIVLNRPARKFRAITVDVISTKVTTDLDGTAIILVNEGLDSELRIPISPDMTKAGIVTDDAVAKALKGEDTNIHFSDLEKLVKILNVLNQNEKNRLTRVREDIDLAIKRIDSAIAENVKKVEVYKRELHLDANTSVLESHDGTVQINLHE